MSREDQSIYRDNNGKLMCSGCNTEVFGGMCDCIMDTDSELDTLIEVLDGPPGFAADLKRLVKAKVAEARLDEGQMVEQFRKVLMQAHHNDWTMEVISEAAHICARSLYGTDRK